jgi:hypothetical protein
MCEITDTCKRKSRFYVLIRTVPQPLGPNGAYGMESTPASRSNTSCAAHLPRAVRTLNALPIRLYDAAAIVREI